MATYSIPQSLSAALINPTLTQTFNVVRTHQIMVQMTVAVAALTGFSIGATPTSGSTPSILYNTSADFSSPKGILLGASGDLTTQGIGIGWFILSTVGLHSITLTFSSGGTATVATTIGGGA